MAALSLAGPPFYGQRPRLGGAFVWEERFTMEAVITVVGADRVGILAQVCTACAQHNVNVEEVTQRILRGTFAMIMLVEVGTCDLDFSQVARSMELLGKEMGVDIRCTKQELYEAMHRI